MEDYLVKALVHDGLVRAYTAQAIDAVMEAQRRHDAWHVSSVALGRTLVGSLLLDATLKREDKLTIRIQGDGPATGIVVDTDGKEDMKGYIKNPHLSLPLNSGGKIDVQGAVGTQGMFTVTKGLGLKEPFSGQTPIVSGEIAEDFTYYLAISEQIPSTVGLNVLVNADDNIKTMGRFMIQIIPGVDEETISKIEEQLKTTPRISTLLDKGQTPEEILKGLLGTERLNILEKMPVQFKCDYSKKRFAEAVITLDAEGIQAMINEDHDAEAVCSFCNNKYKYSGGELDGLRKKALGGI